MGRPSTWEDPEAFEKSVDEYFATKDITHTWTGLAIHLGFESRQSLEDYKKKPGFSYPIKKALIQIESMYEQNLFKGNPTGSIFALKNFGWSDKQEIEQKTEHSGQINHTIDHSKLSDAALREIADLDKPTESKD